MNHCICDWMFILLHDEAALPTKEDVDVYAKDVQMWVARVLGWLPAGDRNLGRSLRGRGKRRKILDSIVQIRRIRGVKPSGLVTQENFSLVEAWVSHLKESAFSESQFEDHVDECLEQTIRPPAEHTIPERVFANCRKRMSDGFRMIKRRHLVRGGPEVRVLAGLADLSTDAVWRALRGGRKLVGEDDAVLPNELVFPRGAGSARICVDLGELNRALKHQQ